MLDLYAEEDRYECIDDIYNTYYIDDLKLLTKAFGIDLGTRTIKIFTWRYNKPNVWMGNDW